MRTNLKTFPELTMNPIQTVLKMNDWHEEFVAWLRKKCVGCMFNNTPGKGFCKQRCTERITPKEVLEVLGE
jgi:hypothetical protein